MYAILVDSLNHTCVFLVNADTQGEALRNFILDQLGSVGFDSDKGLYFDLSSGKYFDSADELLQDINQKWHLRFEVHEAVIDPRRQVQQIVCSADQIHDISSESFENHLGLRHYQLGLIYSTIGRYEDGLHELEVAERRLPRNPSIIRTLADTAYALDRFDTALAAYKRCLEVISEDDLEYDNCLYGLGTANRQLGNHKDAIQYFRQYLSLQGEDDSEPAERDQREEDIHQYLELHEPDGLSS